MKANPAIIEEERAKRNLLADQPKEVLDEVVPFYTEAVKEGVYAPLEDVNAVAKVRLRVLHRGGPAQGPAGDLKVEEYLGYRARLRRRKKKLGG